LSEELELRRAPLHRDGHPLVLDGEPRLVYQPIIDLTTGRLLGFEALLRWHHPTEGIIFPPLLIPWAEANGDIVALGDWVVMAGCEEATRWPSSMQLAVNMSIVQLRRGAASPAVTRALQETGLPADRLTVEVTERAMSDDDAVADLRTIGDLGVQIAVDDVGTSWSSFDVLRRLAVNTVKIDGSFVGALEAHEGINRMVVETVINLAHHSGMATVAEGVETELHSSIVREFDSDAAQGYFFAPPLSQENATAMANLADLVFPLDGEGWQRDDWPFPGASENGNDPMSNGAPPAALEPTGLTSAIRSLQVEMDAIDLVDMVLTRPVEPLAGTNAADEDASGPVGDEAAAEPDRPARPAAKARSTRATSRNGNGSSHANGNGNGNGAGNGHSAKAQGAKVSGKNGREAAGAGRAAKPASRSTSRRRSRSSDQSSPELSIEPDAGDPEVRGAHVKGARPRRPTAER